MSQMSKEASVAPKERVNITYVPATGDAAEEVELPLRVLLFGDYTGREDDTPLEERRVIDVDPGTFAEVLRAQDLRLDLEVEDRLSGEPDQSLALRLRLTSLEDFTPEGIAAQVPALRQLLALRADLTALKSPLTERVGLRKRLQALLGSDEGRAALRGELGLGDDWTG